jgi:hypothetical protein
MRRTTAAEGVLQRRLWGLAGQAIAGAPLASAPRLYVDSLNATFDAQETRLSSLTNRVPGAVLALEVFGAVVARGAGWPCTSPSSAAGSSPCSRRPR